MVGRRREGEREPGAGLRALQERVPACDRRNRPVPRHRQLVEGTPGIGNRDRGRAVAEVAYEDRARTGGRQEARVSARPEVDRGDAQRRHLDPLLRRGVGEHPGPAGIGGAGGGLGRARPRHEVVDVVGRVGVHTVVEPQRGVGPGDPRGRAVLAQRAQRPAGGHDVTAVAVQVRPSGRHGEPGAGPAVVHDGLDRHAVAARDAGAEADHGVVEEEPGFERLQRALQAVEVLAHGGVRAVGRAADPFGRRAGVAPRAARAVGQPPGGDRRARQPVGVHGGPEGVGVVVAVPARPPVEHPRAGVPAAQVLAVAVLVARHAGGGHADRRAPAEPAVNGAGARREQPVPGGLGGGRDGRVVQHRRQPPVEREIALGRRREHGLDGVADGPALDHGAPAGPLGLRGGLGQQQDRRGDLPAPPVVAVRPSGDAPAAYEVHAGAVVDEGRERQVDGVEHGARRRVGDLPRCAAQHGEQRREAGQQHRAISALIGDGPVLDERAVAVEAVAIGDVGEHRGERGDRERGTIGICPGDRPQQRDRAQIDPVRPGAVALVVVQAALRHEGVHRRAQRRDLGVRHIRGRQHGGVEQRPGRPDLPVPPVARLLGVLGVHVAHVVLDARGYRRAEPRLRGQPGAGQRVRAGHRPQPGRGGVERGEGQVGPERSGGRRHRVAVPAGLRAQPRQPAPVRLPLRVEGPGISERDLAPSAAQQGEGRGVGLPAGSAGGGQRGEPAELQK